MDIPHRIIVFKFLESSRGRFFFEIFSVVSVNSVASGVVFEETRKIGGNTEICGGRDLPPLLSSAASFFTHWLSNENLFTRYDCLKFGSVKCSGYCHSVFSYGKFKII